MNFARTNLSLLLARQNRQHAALGRTGSVGADRQASLWAAPRLVSHQSATRVAPVVQPAPSTGSQVTRSQVASSQAASSQATGSQALELVGAIAMMAAFMVLALFG